MKQIFMHRYTDLTNLYQNQGKKSIEDYSLIYNIHSTVVDHLLLQIIGLEIRDLALY